MAAVEGHPNIITYYDSWAEFSSASGGDHQHIKLELCGDSLRSSVRSRQPLPTHELWEILRQVRERWGLRGREGDP